MWNIVQHMCHMNLVIDLADRRVCCSVVEHWSTEFKGLRFDSSWGQRIFSLSHARDKTKNIFLISFPSPKLTISTISTYKHYAINIADPRSVQDACHMNFVKDLAHCSLCGSVVEHWRVESKGLRFDSSFLKLIFSWVLFFTIKYHDSPQNISKEKDISRNKKLNNRGLG